MLPAGCGGREAIPRMALVGAPLRRPRRFRLPGRQSRLGLLLGLRAWMGAPERAPYGRLIFEVHADGLAHPEKYRDRAEAITGWFHTLGATVREIATGPDGTVTPTLGMAVVRGLLFDLTATGDRHRTDRALDPFCELLQHGMKTNDHGPAAGHGAAHARWQEACEALMERVVRGSRGSNPAGGQGGWCSACSRTNRSGGAADCWTPADRPRRGISVRRRARPRPPCTGRIQRCSYSRAPPRC